MMWLGIEVSAIVLTSMKTSYLMYHLVADHWEIYGFQDSSICKRVRSGQSGRAISHVI